MKHKVLGLILAGGHSRRLGGGDKALRPLGDASILHQVCTRLQAQLADIIISANSEPAFFSRFAFPVIDDGAWHGSGPLAGILAGCRHAAQHGYSHILSVAADTPFFPEDLLQKLVQKQTDSNAEIIFARSGNEIHPTFALWPAAIANPLESWLQQSKRRSIRIFAAGHSCAYADFDMPDAISGLDPFFNINTYQELAQARSAWQLHQPADFEE
ncbi:molybdenum cofactor guanylyltransferase MobA [Pseudochrobactrum sp. HB0163]|uniref:molybdenum cofactor guanylyltransferase MobA n=1 Tax=Pseudochrobactrum sp. HB0163 TaxID=3450708 RepID=UPI003F6DE35F